jgi:hypothetical protein
MTREEIEAKLEAVEARTETRFVELSGKIDRLGEILTGERGVLVEMALRMDTFAQMTALKADNRTTRWTVAVTMITSVLAAAALVLSVQANLLSTFQAGQPQGAVSAPR